MCVWIVFVWSLSEVEIEFGMLERIEDGLGGGYKLRINFKSTILEESDDVSSEGRLYFSGTDTKLGSCNIMVIDAD